MKNPLKRIVDGLNFGSVKLTEASMGVGGILVEASQIDSNGYVTNDGRPAALVSSSSGATKAREYPDVTFADCYIFYKTLGKVQNSCDMTISKVIARHWYYESTDPAQKYDAQIKQLEQWEIKFNWAYLIEAILRDLIITGNCFIDLAIWRPVQITMIESMERDKYGQPLRYIFLFNGQPIALDPSKFLHLKWIDADRAAFGLGAFHSVFNANWYDSDVKKPKAIAAILRVMQQDAAKIHHKFASPRVIYGFDNVNKEVFDRDIAPLISKMGAGDRLALSKLPTIVTETVDARARFTDSIDLINSEIQAGLQSSTNPILAQQSAKATLGTSRVGNTQDEDRLDGVLEKIRRIFDYEILPKILGPEFAGKITLKFGTPDDYDYSSQELQVWLEQGVISKGELRNMLRKALPLDDTLYQKDIAEQEQKQQDKMQQQQDNQMQMMQQKRSGSIAAKPDTASEAITKAAEAIAASAGKSQVIDTKLEQLSEQVAVLANAIRKDAPANGRKTARVSSRGVAASNSSDNNNNASSSSVTAGQSDGLTTDDKREK